MSPPTPRLGSRLVHGIATLGLGLALAPVVANAVDEAPTGSSGAKAAAPAPPPAPVYQLPKVGKPRGRIGGGRRGPILGGAEMQALVPDHVGQTTAAQPSLFWYLAEPVQGEVAFEVTLVSESSIDPVADRRLARPDRAGLQRIRLADLGVSLDPGQEYQWSVAVVPDPRDHAKDVVTSGWIQRVTAPEGLEGRLKAAGPDGAAAVYGEAGLWYDMLAAACDRVGAHPDDERYRQELAVVLEQVGLPGAAAGPRGAGSP
jgi:hypothetical protein